MEPINRSTSNQATIQESASERLRSTRNSSLNTAASNLAQQLREVSFEGMRPAQTRGLSFDTVGRGVEIVRLPDNLSSEGAQSIESERNEREPSIDLIRMIRGGSAASVETVGLGNPLTPVTPQARQTNACYQFPYSEFPKPARGQ